MRKIVKEELGQQDGDSALIPPEIEKHLKGLIKALKADDLNEAKNLIRTIAAEIDKVILARG